jgi:hypothetical protein
MIKLGEEESERERVKVSNSDKISLEDKTTQLRLICYIKEVNISARLIYDKSLRNAPECETTQTSPLQGEREREIEMIDLGIMHDIIALNDKNIKKFSQPFRFAFYDAPKNRMPSGESFKINVVVVACT